MSKWWDQLMGKDDDGKPDDEGQHDEPEFELDEEGEPKVGDDGTPIRKKKEEPPVPTAAEIAAELHKIQKAEKEEARRLEEEKKRKESKPAAATKLEEMRARATEIEDDAFQDASLFKELQQLNRDIAKAEALEEFNNKVGDRLNFADDIASQQLVAEALEPLDDDEKAAAVGYMRTTGITPEQLKDKRTGKLNPVLADMIQSKARLLNFEKTGVMNEKPIPGAVGTRGKPAPDTTLQSGDEANIVKGFEKIAQKLSDKQAKNAKPIKLDRAELTGRKN